MSDPNIRDFQGRLGRIDQVHRHGGGFEAAGALGMGDFKRRRPRRGLLRMMALLVVLVVFIVLLKVGMQLVMGSGVYAERVKMLEAGSQLDRIGAYVLQPDTVSTAIADKFKRYMP